MTDIFLDDEKLYRAVRPIDMFWKEDGTLSSAAFQDSNGLSVDRGNYREDREAKRRLLMNLHGTVVMFSVKDCNDVTAIVKYLPTEDNEYHSEVHKSVTEKKLTKSQQRHLAKVAKII